MVTVPGLITAQTQLEMANLKEVLESAVNHYSNDRPALTELLRIRYGLTDTSLAFAYDTDLMLSLPQKLLGALITLCVGFIIVFLASIVIGVQVLTLRAIYLEPNYSQFVSLLVIFFALAVDLYLVGISILSRSIQPFATLADFKRLNEIKKTDRKQYDDILKDIAKHHFEKSLLIRLFTRPRMKRVT